MRCRDHAYEFTRLEVPDVRVSIVTHFSGAYDLDNMKLTLTSVVLHTPYDLYHEIIVIDDGTDSQQTQQALATFLQDSRFNKVSRRASSYNRAYTRGDRRCYCRSDRRRDDRL